MAEAFCAVHQLTGEGRWLTLAGQLLDVALAHFATGRGGFYDTADDAEKLITRPADPTDNATPSGLSAVVAGLVAYSALTGEPRYREVAEAALATVAPIVARHARFTGYAAASGEALLSGPYEVAIVTTDPVGDPLVAAARRHAPPGAVVVAGAPDQEGCRCWRTGRCWRAAPRRTSAGVSSVIALSVRWKTLSPSFPAGSRRTPPHPRTGCGGRRHHRPLGLPALWIPEPVCPLSAWWGAVSSPG